VSRHIPLHASIRAGAGAALAILLWATSAAAQEPPSVGDAADRPGFADSPVLAGRGHILFETGFTWEREGSDLATVRTFAWPQVELHGGVASWLDLAVIWDGVVAARTRVATHDPELEGTTTGLDDFRLGVKVRLVQRPRFNSALIGYVNVPVGSAVISRRYAEPFTRLAWAFPLTERFAVAGTVDLKGVKEDDDHVRAKPAGSAAFSSSLIDSLDGFVGMVTEAPDFGSRPSVWSVEAGLVRAIGEKHQIDIWIGRRIVGDPDDWFISAGFIRRLR
jgi:hypothetical protein